MNRLAKKFIIILTLMIIDVNFLCILVNSLFIEHYSLKMNQLNLDKIYQEADLEVLNIKMIDAFQFTTLIFILGMVGRIVLINLLVKRMTKPLTQLSTLSQQIANLDFQKVEVHIKDEIEDLAHHINHMSLKHLLH